MRCRFFASSFVLLLNTAVSLAVASRPSDIIGDFPVNDPQALRYRITTRMIGEKVQLTVQGTCRDGNQRRCHCIARLPLRAGECDERQNDAGFVYQRAERHLLRREKTGSKPS